MSKFQALGKIEALVHDFDGVIYGLDAVPTIYNDSDDAMASAFRSIIPLDVSQDEAKEMAKEGYRKYGDSVHIFFEWAISNGLDDIEGFRQRLFEKFHRDLFLKISANAPHILCPSPDLIEGFEASRHIKKGIATHSCPKNWVQPFITQSGLAKYFESHAILGLSDVGFARKSEDPALVNACLAALQAAPRQSGFIEDSQANLKTAKDHLPELTTIFLHHGRPDRSAPAFIDFQFRDLSEMKRALNRAQSEERKIIAPVFI